LLQAFIYGIAQIEHSTALTIFATKTAHFPPAAQFPPIAPSGAVYEGSTVALTRTVFLSCCRAASSFCTHVGHVRCVTEKLIYTKIQRLNLTSFSSSRSFSASVLAVI
jgi:hypothetical protein